MGRRAVAYWYYCRIIKYIRGAGPVASSLVISMHIVQQYNVHTLFNSAIEGQGNMCSKAFIFALKARLTYKMPGLIGSSLSEQAGFCGTFTYQSIHSPLTIDSKLFGLFFVFYLGRRGKV